MAAPWEKYAQPKTAGPWANYAAQPASQAEPAQQSPSFGAQLGSAAVRPVVKAVASLPLLAMDSGVAIRNLIAGKNDKGLYPYELPSDTFNQYLDSYTVAPTGVGKAAEFVSTVAAGAGLPAPTSLGVGRVAPAGFVAPDKALRQGAVNAAQEAGYVVPPSSGNPSIVNRMLEGISGKLKLNQEASIRNQATTTAAAARELGQNPAAPLTQDALRQIRMDSVQRGYEPIRTAGAIAADEKYAADLARITAASQGAERSFPGIAQTSKEIDSVIAPLKQSRFDSGDAVDAISILRAHADDAYQAGKASVGKAYKDAAKAVESAIERHLVRLGEPAKDMLRQYREARQLIAKSIDVGRALNEATGQVSATKLAQLANRGRPLSGGLLDAANAARAFPKATREVTENMPAVSPLDAYGAAIAAGASGNPSPLLIPLTRVGIRNYLLSGQGQANALAGPGPVADPQYLNALFGVGLPSVVAQ